MDVVVKRDPNNNRSRGFGFILFKEDNCVEKVNVFFNEYCPRYCGKKSGCQWLCLFKPFNVVIDECATLTARHLAKVMFIDKQFDSVCFL